MANEFIVKHGLIVASGTITGDGSGLTGAGVTDHGALTGLQGGDTDEYYHLNVHEEAQISATASTALELGPAVIGDGMKITLDADSVDITVTVSGGPPVDLYEFRNNFFLSHVGGAGYRGVAGTSDTVDLSVGEAYDRAGEVKIYSSDTTGGELGIYIAQNYQGAYNLYHIQTVEDDLQIGPSNDYDSLIYHGDTSQWEFTGAAGIKAARFDAGATTFDMYTSNGEKAISYFDNSGVILYNNNLRGLQTQQGYVGFYGPNGSTTVTTIGTMGGLNVDTSIRNGVTSGKIYIRGLDSNPTEVGMAILDPNGSVELNYHDAKKFETTNSGIEVTGGVFVSDMKSGDTQVNAGAVVDELWRTDTHATLPDGVVMIGI